MSIPDSRDAAPRPARRTLAAIAAAAVAALGLASLSATPALAADTTHTIAEVQGTGAATPLSGQTVTVEGVVTGYYAAPSNYRGLYLQTAESGGDDDATPGASDGIFVYFNQLYPDVEIGDLVRVTGTAGEYQGQTQLTATSASAYELITADVGLPEVTPLPDTVVGDDREALEGMLVETTGDYRLASTHELYNFGSLWLSAGGELVKSTETTDAGPAADAIAASNLARRLVVDDGYSIRVDNSQHVGDQPYLTADTVVRNGDRFVAPEEAMILGYGFDAWRLQPQIPLTDASDASYKPTFETLNPRPESAPEVGGDVQFGSFNVFNYFTTFGGDARGADDAEEFAEQKAKVVAAINGLGADVIALEEIENSAVLGEETDEALADLVDGLNADAGAGTWDYVRSPDAITEAGNDVITTAIIFKPALATPVGDSFADTDAVWDIARKPVAQTFDIGDERLVTVVANHFKSKSPPSGNTAPEPADGQGFFNSERTAQAERLVEFVDGIADDPEKSPDVILLGDFNAYGQEDPAQVLTAAGFTDLVPTKAEGQYTYTFNGELGSLDHAFVSSSLAASVTGVGVWGINSAEWSDRGYAFGATDGESPFRSSDHDPVIVGVTSAAPPVTIDLLSINDFHGRLEATSTTAGAAVLGGMVRSYEEQNPNTLFVGAGDLIGASTFTSFIQNDEPTIDAFNEIGLDASSFGNHEFDKGRADVDDRILEHADWPYLAANLYDTTTGEPAYQEYELREFDGVTIGFIGAVTEDLPTLVSPAGISTLDVREVVPEVNRVADQLSDGDESNGEADVLVLLVHEGAATTDISSATDDSKFGRIVNGADPEIDMIISGHTHLAYDHDVPIPGTDRTRPVISAGQYGAMYGHSTIVVDPATDEVTIDTEILDLIGAFEPDPAVAQIVQDAVDVAQELGSVSLGEITEDIRRAVQSTGSENRGGESTLGNLIADAQLAATADLDTEVALMNPGGIRADLVYASSGAGDPDGNVTYAEAAGIQPFANTLVTMNLTGDQLAQVLEEQWQPEGAPRPFLKLGLSEGLSYVYDPAAPAGEHITSITLNGEQVTGDQVIRIVTNSFLASGGDNFTTLAEGTDRADSGRIDLDAFVDYIGENSPVAPPTEQRSVGATLSAPADGEAYLPGEEVTAELSSLLFSAVGDVDGDATVSLDGTVLGTAPVDFAIVDTLDEQGTSTVTFTIPDGTPEGVAVLEIGGPGGTLVELPITFGAGEEQEPVATRTSGSAPFLVWRGTPVDYKVTVRTEDGSPAVGTLVIRDGLKIVAQVDLTAADAGHTRVQLGKLSRGLHVLTAQFSGDGFERSLSWPSLVLVL
ncbi:ExeM/NucH family extracellular endonuclease [Homoserinibacter sp. GY 40078]|uniref:ExeM/NucH family extracellular endonuclease n=1 Tax=Homoserinibacter sp. GY 40078 TaxID=2603275 RepID=UPI0011C7F7E7|nr:ExeM/NucH family extracellular endonuclease [Homoserinibacter sp. GY 40078]TXK18707.1 ExeM/NucH family extracellular endonuclease [Homoserinibacter sp. GY 40078]